MKLFASILCIALLASPCFAGEYTVESMVPDLQPGDGIMEAGSIANPYVVSDSDGQEVGTMEPMTPDLVPNDGFMDAGSISNPWVIRKE